MLRCRSASDSPRRLQALAFLLSLTSTLGLEQTVQLYRSSASLDNNSQRRLFNVLYYGTMQLGTPGQELTFCPDTGSAALWTSADITPPTASGNSNIAPSYNGFVSNASSSFQLNSYSFAEKYNSGGVVGVLASDRVQLGDIVIGNASLGLVKEASVDLMGASCAAVLGLARPGLAMKAGTAIFYRMLAEQGLLDRPSFSLWLDPDPAAEPAGSLTFGGIDAKWYSGALTNITVISSKYWMVPLGGVQAAGMPLPITARGAILDSSSAFSLVTDRDFLIFEPLPGVSYSRQTGSFQVIGGCANITSLPNLTVSLGGHNFTLTPRDYVVQISGSACALAFQPGAPDNTVVLGTGFLRAYFTVYTYNATSRSSYVSLAPAAPGNSTTARRRMQELGEYPGAVPISTGDAQPPRPTSASSAAASANALGGAADQDALLAAMLAAQSAASVPTPAPAPASVPTSTPGAATAAVPSPTQALSPADAAPVLEGINTTNTELFPEVVLPAGPPVPALAAAPAPLTAPISDTLPTGAPTVAPAPQAELAAATPAPAPQVGTAAAASGPAAAGPLPAGSPIPMYPLAALEAPTPGPVVPQPEQAPVEAPALAPASLQEAAAVAAAPESAPLAAPLAAPGLAPGPAPSAAPVAAPQPQPADIKIPVTTLIAAPAPAPAGPDAISGAPAPAESGAVAPVSLAAPTPAPLPSAETADISIPVAPLAAPPAAAPAASPESAAQEAAEAPNLAAAPSAQPADISIPAAIPAAAPVGVPALAPAAAAEAAARAPGPSPEELAPVASPVLAPASAPVPLQQPTDASIPVNPAEAAPVSAPAPAPPSAGPVSAFSLEMPALGAAPAPAPGEGPAPAPASAAAIPGAGAPQPAAIEIPVTPLIPAPLDAPTMAPALAPAPSESAAAAPASATTPSTAPVQAPAASAAVSAASAPAVMPPSMEPLLAPAPAPIAAGPMSARGPFGTLFPAGAGVAQDVQPPFQAIPGLEVLYGGLGSLWRLPLQLSTLNDTLFSSYLAAHPLTARQNRTLAKPRPPTPPGFGQPINLVKLTDFFDTCVVGWSSVNSCIVKGLNSTTCALMPIFDDVDTVPYQCPYKNETQVQVPAGSGNYVPINQQWLLVKPGIRGQQIYNVGLGKCLDICTDQAAASLCGHAGNVYLQDCDATAPTQQWLLDPTALANATVSSANRADLAMYQISNAYVPPVAMQAFGAAPLNQTCIETCEAERDAVMLPNAYGETTCNSLLPTYPSSATVFPCKAQRLPHSISQGFAIAFAPQPLSA